MKSMFRSSALIGAILLAVSGTQSIAEEALQKIRLGLPATAIAPVHIDVTLPEALGYFKEEGLTVEAVPLGSYATAFANMNSGRLEMALNVPSFQLPVLAKDGSMPDINFYESAYPFRFYLAVKPGSPFKSIQDLKGKRIGDSGPGFASRTIARAVVKMAGLDPDNDVSWLGVGDGTSGGIALDRGDIDALFYADTAIGLVEAAGMKLTYLPLPSEVPKIGGIYLATTNEMLAKNRKAVIGFGRAVAKAHIFIRENPEAAAYVFAKMFPEALPKGKSLEEQVKAVMVPVNKRKEFYVPYDATLAAPGLSSDAEWRDEIDFANLNGKIPPLPTVYTNDLVKEINDFDVEKVKAQARNYKLPYKN